MFCINKSSVPNPQPGVEGASPPIICALAVVNMYAFLLFSHVGESSNKEFGHG